MAMPVVLSVFESGQFSSEKAGGAQGTETYATCVLALSREEFLTFSDFVQGHLIRRAFRL